MRPGRATGLRPLRRRKASGPPGATLLETLIAASVLLVALLGTSGAFLSAFLQVSGGGHITKATGLAHQMMEGIRSDPSFSIPQYAGRDGRGVSTDAPATFPDDWPGPCSAGWTGGDQFCGNTKLQRWRRDITGDSGDGRALAQGRGTVAVADHENPIPEGGGPLSAATSLLRITVTVSWSEPTGPRQVTLTSTVPCPRSGCT